MQGSSCAHSGTSSSLRRRSWFGFAGVFMLGCAERLRSLVEVFRDPELVCDIVAREMGEGQLVLASVCMTVGMGYNVCRRTGQMRFHSAFIRYPWCVEDIKLLRSCQDVVCSLRGWLSSWQSYFTKLARSELGSGRIRVSLPSVQCFAYDLRSHIGGLSSSVLVTLP